MQLFLISGLSGSGKSIALKVLEDSGYYCVDNLPADLLAALVEHLQRAGYSNIAVSIDVRSANSVQRLPPLLQQIKQQGVDVHVLFLDAQTETLVKRFSETRRRHPLAATSIRTNANPPINASSGRTSTLSPATNANPASNSLLVASRGACPERGWMRGACDQHTIIHHSRPR